MADSFRPTEGASGSQGNIERIFQGIIHVSGPSLNSTPTRNCRKCNDKYFLTLSNIPEDMIRVASIPALWPKDRLRVLLHFVGTRDNNRQRRSLTLPSKQVILAPLYHARVRMTANIEAEIIVAWKCMDGFILTIKWM
jgi:hypothetical protein